MEYGCIGRTLKHSFSKTIHNALFDYDYQLKELEPEQLERFMRERDFKGINVTIPYKQAVMPYLDFIDEKAQSIGAVNTVVNRGGRLYGYNTDFYGMNALAAHAGVELSGRRVAITGSGGTSKTALALARHLGAESVFRVSRTARDGCIDYEQMYEYSPQVIINTTPCGMYPELDGAACDVSRLPCLTGVIDAVYNPLRTRLVLEARSRGAAASGGLYMLVSQAAAAAERFLDCKIAADRTDSVYSQLVRQKENIVLIGMPSVGKSTIGAVIAKRLGREFVDTDTVITERYGAITDIFAKHGEAYFRDIESKTVSELAPRQGLVIATGGGTVLRAENTARLRQNGRLCFINRDPGRLVSTPDRPLADSPDKLCALYEKRLPIYRAACDISVDIGENADENADRILEECGYEN